MITLLQVVGYAKDSWNHHPLKQQATDTSYQLISRNECEKNGFIMNFKYPETFCATANEKPDGSGKVVNIQDSGSGLYIKKDDVWFLGGIISKASPTDSTVIFTDVFQFTEWIRRKNH